MKDTLPKCLGKDHTEFLNILIFLNAFNLILMSPTNVLNCQVSF